MVAIGMDVGEFRRTLRRLFRRCGLDEQGRPRRKKHRRHGTGAIRAVKGPKGP